MYVKFNHSEALLFSDSENILTYCESEFDITRDYNFE